MAPFGPPPGHPAAPSKRRPNFVQPLGPPQAGAIARRELTRKLAPVLVWMTVAAVGVSAGAGDEATSKLDSIFAPLAIGTSPGLAVLVQKDGRTLFRKGY